MNAAGARPVRGVLLDAAGTLIHPQQPIGESYSRIARRHGVRVPASRLEEAFRRVHRAAPPMVFPGERRERVPELERAWWRERVRETFRAADGLARFADFGSCFDELFAHFAASAAWRPAPGAAEGLAGLRRAGRRLAVVSNFDQRLPALLEGLGLARELAGVFLPGEMRLAKPDPGVFREACLRLGVAPAEAVSVGDEPAADLEPARRAGLRAIDVRELATLAELPARIAALEEDPIP